MNCFKTRRPTINLFFIEGLQRDNFKMTLSSYLSKLFLTFLCSGRFLFSCITRYPADILGINLFIMKIILFHDIISTYLCIDPRRLKRWAYHDRDDLILILPETCFSASPFPLKIDSHHENVSKLYIAVDGNSHINYREMLQNINKSSAGWELQLRQHKDGLCGRVRV